MARRQLEDHEIKIGRRVVTNEGYWGTVESVALEETTWEPTWYNVRYDEDADHDRAGYTVMQDASRMTTGPDCFGNSDPKGQ
jgi:hypothetical protein